MSEQNKDQKPIQNGNPYDLVDNENQKKENTNPEKKESGIFVKKIVKIIAKLAGLPDPETGVSESTSKPAEKQNEKTTKQETTLEQDVVAQEEQKAKEEEKKAFNFDKIMSGVTGVLDKIEKKVEEKTGLDLDAPLKKREEKLKKESEENKTEVATNTTETTNEPTTENEVEKNNEEYLSK